MYTINTGSVGYAQLAKHIILTIRAHFYAHMNVYSQKKNVKLVRLSLRMVNLQTTGSDKPMWKKGFEPIKGQCLYTMVIQMQP